MTFQYQSVLGTEASDIWRDHIWLPYVWFYTCFMNKIWNIDISQYKGYFSTRVNDRYGNKELPTRPYLVTPVVLYKLNFTPVLWIKSETLISSSTKAILVHKSMIGTEIKNFRRDHIWLETCLNLHSFVNKIWNIDISQYKGYFSSKSDLGTEIKNFPRDHIWLTYIVFNFDFTQFYE